MIVRQGFLDDDNLYMPPVDVRGRRVDTETRRIASRRTTQTGIEQGITEKAL
jgi:hypothetical protein